MLGTDQRIGDVLKMRWGDIEDGTIKVTQGKTGVRLTLPLTTSLRDALAAVARVEPKVALIIDGRHAGPPILQRLDGGPIGYRVVADEIMEVRRKIGDEDFDNHALRHASAVELAELGLTDEQIIAVTGHKDSATLRIYTHEARQRARAKQAMAARKQAVTEARISEQESEQGIRG